MNEEDQGIVEAEIIEAGDKEEEKIIELHHRFPGTEKGRETVEHEIGMLYGGLFDEILELMEDEEYRPQLETLFGEKAWERFYELRDVFYTESMTPAEWKKSPERKELYEMVLRVYRDPTLRDHIRLFQPEH